MSSVENRQREISVLLKRFGTVHIHDLAERLQTSLDTIRRDLRQMEGSGHLRRIHGGAVLPATNDGTYQERSLEVRPERAAIARHVAHHMIPDDAVVFFDSGTTVLDVARHLKPAFYGTAIVVNPAVAVVLADHANANVIMIGGKIIKGDMVVSGAATIAEICHYHADICILGTCAIHPDLGVSTRHIEERASKAAMIAQSGDVIAIATADKLETRMPFKVCDVDAVSTLVTGRKLSESYLANYQTHGIDVVLV
ncbi:DeoR/GlpR family DNA-binding transcription regulator [Thalassospira mesophila]|uniref:DeoR family transcriptional regulator n=1 Tax=Thalassospira mesophila TaxID=1293891 RepID=A0A1Y2KZ42_9PROT|nr:DeoR/GlpR family DNA-binding transcription regulator [Thalassospira mesophila]OSQ37876.1 DeoR family transcriptional regulator [Thalassospira mesophila]